MKIRDAKSCRFDLVSLGESMIRLSPPQHGRIEFAPVLEQWVGGGEYNVSYALSRLGLRTSWIGGLNSSPMGAVIRNHARAVGMDVSYVVERKYDGVGKKDRIGLNFTEVGVAKRGSVTLYDRGHTATSGMQPGDVNWKKLFNEDGVRWLHTGGIFASLSESTRLVAAEAVKAAHEAGTIVSYDLNFRSKLWSSKDAIATTKPLVPYIDVLIGNEEDFEQVLGFEAEGVDVHKAGALDVGPFKAMVERVVKTFPNVKVVGTTLRGVKTATINDWSAIMWARDGDSATGKFYDGPNFPDLEIEDRVGGGDGFASGFTYGFLAGKTPQECVNLGVAHGALLMSTMGDTSQITLEELLHIAGGGSARIKR
ncbi:sugar kinase [Humisphaera borealis]|uniref:Sugar kinase n=1 Tax=Humisphaera borealis TaxID=2807512 RepID=A0A7M2WZ68_9BACT|nr:sugar kinase [Humisphaera borealis]QOV90683.1 sugar kinase [Humisphaera borealis]